MTQLSPFVLKHVAKPAKVIGASLYATGLSMALSSVFLIVLFILNINFYPGLIVFPVLQFWAIYRTSKDPYWVEVMMANFKCKKTKNFKKTRHNYYGH